MPEDIYDEDGELLNDGEEFDGLEEIDPSEEGVGDEDDDDTGYDEEDDFQKKNSVDLQLWGFSLFIHVLVQVHSHLDAVSHDQSE